MRFFLGKKLGMSTIYHKDKGAIPVTLVEYGPNIVTQVRSKEKDGYTAIQVGLRKDQFRKAEFQTTKGKKFFLKIKEFRGNLQGFKIGDEIKIDQFQIGEKVKVSGISKAKGFQGVVKRHGFKGSPRSHGHKHDWRAPGSIGSSFPEHVLKGKKMAGRMGGERVSVKNLEIVDIDKENNILFLKGAVPGVRGRIVEIMSND